MAGESGTEAVVVGEPRWHSAGAVVAAIVLTILMPDDCGSARTGCSLLSQACCSSLTAGDPGRIDRRSASLRTLSIGLVSVLVLGALSATALLISHLIDGGKETNSADALLEAGSIVRASNIIAFALLYRAR